MAIPSCFRLLTHCERRAASRAAWTAGRSRAIRTAMMAITTRSSISVKPRDGARPDDLRSDMVDSPWYLRTWTDWTGRGAPPDGRGAGEVVEVRRDPIRGRGV